MSSPGEFTTGGTLISRIPAKVFNIDFGIRRFYSTVFRFSLSIMRPDGTIVNLPNIDKRIYEHCDIKNSWDVLSINPDTYLAEVCSIKFGTGFVDGNTNFPGGVHKVRFRLYRHSISLINPVEDTGWINYNMVTPGDPARESVSLNGFFYRVRGYTCVRAYINPYLSLCYSGYPIFDDSRIRFKRKIEVMDINGTITTIEEFSSGTSGSCGSYAEMSNLPMNIDNPMHIRISVYHHAMGHILMDTGWIRNGIPSVRSISNDCTISIDEDKNRYINSTMGEYLPDVLEKKSGDDLTLSYTVNSTYKDTTDWTLVPIFKGDTDIIIDDYRIVNLGLDTGPVTITHDVIIPVTTKSGYYKLYIYYDTVNLTYPNLPRYAIDTDKLLYIDTGGIPSLMSASISCGTITVS